LATTAAAQNLNHNDRIKAAGGGFFWLSAFYLVYCARPEDWLHAMSILPLAKITGVGAFLALLFGAGKGKRRFRDLPPESYYLLTLIVVLFLSCLFSPIWRGGALTRTLDFSKVYVVWVLTFLLVTDLARFRRIIFIQAASVSVICLLSIIKGHSQPRLEGILGGIYSNPNDLAFAIVLSLPFCFMFLLTARGAVRKLLWIVGMLIMAAALFMTASRGGFITLIVAGAVCLWHFAIKGRRFYLIVASALVGLILLGVAGGPLRNRFSGAWSEDVESKQARRAEDSYEARKFLMERAIEGIKQYPILGLGARNFETYSTSWDEVHMTYLQIAVEGGIPSLILYLMFFGRGFGNLRKLLKRKDLSPEITLSTVAVYSSLVGFVVGALFSPEAYQFFPYFAVAYTSALLALVQDNDRARSVAQKPSLKVAAVAYVGEGRVPVNT